MIQIKSPDPQLYYFTSSVRAAKSAYASDVTAEAFHLKEEG